ncbi:MAG: hypothetical protein JSW23_07315 [Planctomycetota bacterium]|nr:MAG: hypothetical protein JSW23_07315 [Planctomycetota bacterium]
MKDRKQYLTLAVIIIILISTALCWVESAYSDIHQHLKQYSILADVNSVSIELIINSTPGVPMIPQPEPNFPAIRDKLNSAGISHVSPTMPDSNITESSPPCLRIWTYTHYFTMGKPAAFHVQLALARPVTIPSDKETLFYAEVWHSESTMGFASLGDVNDKINKAILGELTDLIIAVRGARKQKREKLGLD